MEYGVEFGLVSMGSPEHDALVFYARNMFLSIM